MSVRATRGPVAVAVAALALLLLVGAGLVAARLPQVHRWIERLAGGAATLPIPHWAAFAVLQLAVAAFGFLPASLIAVAAGAAYGLLFGTLIAAAGTMIGGWIAFVLARSMLRPWIARIIVRFPASARFDAAVAAEGWRFVMLLRVSPVMPFAATSYGLGLTRVDTGAYLIGTLASLPALVLYVAIGAFGRIGLGFETMPAGPIHYVLPALGVAALVLAVTRLRTLARA